MDASFAGDGGVSRPARVHPEISPDTFRLGAPAITPSYSPPYFAAAFRAPRPPFEHPAK
jgi:hypothetical protein